LYDGVAVVNAQQITSYSTVWKGKYLAILYVFLTRRPGNDIL